MDAPRTFPGAFDNRRTRGYAPSLFTLEITNSSNGIVQVRLLSQWIGHKLGIRTYTIIPGTDVTTELSERS